MYNVLKKIETKEDADNMAQSMGWKDDDEFKRDTGTSIIGYWCPVILEPTGDFEVSRSLNENTKLVTIRPILVIVHGRVFNEECEGHVTNDNQLAYIETEKFENLF